MPGEAAAAMVMLKDKLLTNVPMPVRSQMTENPLVAGAAWAQWSQCLVSLLEHHYTKTQQQAASAAAVQHTLS